LVSYLLISINAKIVMTKGHWPQKKAPIWELFFAWKDLRSRTFTTVLHAINMDYKSTNIIQFLCYFNNIKYLNKLNESVRLLDNHMDGESNFFKFLPFHFFLMKWIRKKMKKWKLIWQFPFDISHCKHIHHQKKLPYGNFFLCWIWP
jgi:hypothetical protein